MGWGGVICCRAEGMESASLFSSLLLLSLFSSSSLFFFVPFFHHFLLFFFVSSFFLLFCFSLHFFTFSFLVCSLLIFPVICLLFSFVTSLSPACNIHPDLSSCLYYIFSLFVLFAFVLMLVI